jgi:hypothetical protein
MVDASERPKLLLGEIKRLGFEIEERLQGNALPTVPIESLVDGPHPAATEATDDLETCRTRPVQSVGH